MISANQKISPRQVGLLLILEAFGAGVIVLPRRVAQYAAQDGWLIVLGLTLFACVCAGLLTTVARRFPTQSFMTYTGDVLSRLVAYVLGTGLVVKLLLNASLQLRLFTLLLRRTILPLTPAPVTGAVITALCLYAAAKGIETRARVGEILFFATMLPLFVLFLAALFDVDFTNLLPVFVASPTVLAAGTLRLGYVFAGLESVLLLFPFLNQPAGSRRRAAGAESGAIIGAVAISGALLLLLTAVTLAKFGAAEVQSQTFPLLRMMDMLKIPGSLVERQDALVMSFWIMVIFAAINAALFYSAVLLRDMMQREVRHNVKCGVRHGIEHGIEYGVGYGIEHGVGYGIEHGVGHGVLVAICAGVVFGLSSLPLGIDSIERLLDTLYLYVGTFYLLGLPVLLLLVAKWRGIGGVNKIDSEMGDADATQKTTTPFGGELS